MRGAPCRKLGYFLSGKVDDIDTYPIVMLNDKTSVSVAECVMHRKGLQATFTFTLQFSGVIVITCTLKSRNSVAVSTLLVTRRTYVLGAEEEAFIKGTLITTDSP